MSKSSLLYLLLSIALITVVIIGWNIYISLDTSRSEVRLVIRQMDSLEILSEEIKLHLQKDPEYVMNFSVEK